MGALSLWILAVWGGSGCETLWFRGMRGEYLWSGSWLYWTQHVWLCLEVPTCIPHGSLPSTATWVTWVSNKLFVSEMMYRPIALVRKLKCFFIVVYSMHISQSKPPFHKNQQDSKAPLNLSKDVGWKLWSPKQVAFRRFQKLPKMMSHLGSVFRGFSWILGQMEGFPESHEGLLRMFCRFPRRCLIFDRITIFFKISQPFCSDFLVWEIDGECQWRHVFHVFCFFVSGMLSSD